MILGALAVVLTGAAYISVTRAPKPMASAGPESAAPPPVPTTAVLTTAPAAPSSKLLLGAAGAVVNTAVVGTGGGAADSGPAEAIGLGARVTEM